MNAAALGQRFLTFSFGHRAWKANYYGLEHRYRRRAADGAWAFMFWIEPFRARLRVMVKRVLRKYGYPPDKQEKATQTVLQQAELLCADWAM